MEKINFGSSDMAMTENFIKEIQKAFPNHEVNINNVNDFAIMLEEMKNCKACKGLASCKNTENGYYTDFSDKGFVVVPCKYRKEYEAKNSSLIKTLYLPRKIINASLDEFDTDSESRRKVYTHIVQDIHNLPLDQIKGYYLYGTFSTGKTYTLAVIANEYSKIGKESLLIYFPDLVLDLKNALGDSRFEELVNKLKSIDVLMIDDLGSENITPWVRDEILGPIINYRMMSGLPLYISSNLHPNDLKGHLSIDSSKSSDQKADRIISRMTSLVKSLNMDDSKRYKR